MALEEALGVGSGTVSNLANTALSWVIMIIAIIVFGTIAAFATIFILKQLKYKYNVVWLGIDNKTGGTDRGGIFVDRKTKNKRFFLKKSKVGLNPDNVPFKYIGKKMYVWLYRTGLKNFQYVDINITPNPGAVITVGEEDVNWAVNAYERQKKMFSTSLLMQLMPFIMLAFVSIIILIIFIYFFKEFSTLKDMAVAMGEAAKIIAQARTGVIQ